MRLGSGEEDFTFSKTGMEDSALFLFVLFAIFGFIRLGHYAHASAIGALMAGIAIKNFLPQKRLEAVEREVKAVTYGFFGPLFFLWVGLDVSITVPSQLPFNTGLAPVYVFVGLILMQIILVKTVKIGASYLMGHNHLGVRKSILMGISLSVKFSTSIVILKMLFEQGLIGDALYSVLISAKIGFKFIVPFLLSFLIARWGLD
ncbi:MAG: cation:proton antiporter, partial [Candidatus Nanohaloarchaea archaeon]|nr:cation:proton antiporter [Candidatus Nanohaloarchaea archaeon]